MKTQQNKSCIWHLIISVIVICVLIQFSCTQVPKPRYIDTPEEFNQRRNGDTLIVLKTNKDTIFLGFTGKHI